MNLSSTLACAAAIAAAGSTAAVAQDADSRLSFGASTFGATIEFQQRVHERFALRSMIAGFVNISQDVTVDGTTYATNVQAQGFGGAIDFFPIVNRGLRISAGAYTGGVSVSGNTTATAATPINIGSTTLSNGERVDFNSGFKNEILPMASIGWDQPIRKGNWVFSAEAGAMFTGGLDTNISVTGGITTVAPDQVQAEVDKFQSELPDLKAYPYISLMIGTRF